MDIGQLRGLLLDLDCMTALRHTLRNRAMAALVDLCRACAKDNADEAALTAAYCRVYDAWLDAAAHGRGGFAREALEAVLFEESPAALLCARMDVLPYSLTNALANDLDALGRLTAIEPAMFLLLCERAGMSGQTAARLPVWEPTLGSEMGDPRLSKMMLSREGVTMTAAFFRKQGTGLFARCPGSTWVGESEKYPTPGTDRLQKCIRIRGQKQDHRISRRLLDGFQQRILCLLIHFLCFIHNVYFILTAVRFDLNIMINLLTDVRHRDRIRLFMRQINNIRLVIPQCLFAGMTLQTWLCKDFR